jgi:CxxC motif-containing protein
MKKKLVCIACPIGCSLEAVIGNNGDITVTGNKCKRGEAYAKEEVVAPKRVVTAVVKTNSKKIPYISVKSTCPVPKENIAELLKKIYSMTAELPVSCGDLLLKDFKGIDVVFTKSA